MVDYIRRSFLSRLAGSTVLAPFLPSWLGGKSAASASAVVASGTPPSADPQLSCFFKIDDLIIYPSSFSLAVETNREHEKFAPDSGELVGVLKLQVSGIADPHSVPGMMEAYREAERNPHASGLSLIETQHSDATVKRPKPTGAVITHYVNQGKGKVRYRINGGLVHSLDVLSTHGARISHVSGCAVSWADLVFCSVWVEAPIDLPPARDVYDAGVAAQKAKDELKAKEELA